MPSSAREVYSNTVQALPPAERLRLAALILEELTRTGAPPLVVDAAEVWTEQDQTDLANSSLRYAADLYPESEDLID